MERLIDGLGGGPMASHWHPNFFFFFFLMDRGPNDFLERAAIPWRSPEADQGLQNEFDSIKVW